ncbi:hypothetical protein FOVG_09759 [Fusarium oxysporum f. sp. pisi HDV247]|uniref:Uncharacterized protein n=1 Tax=Fusarium oxysporum f. sp. pisi HDV247 TaxID=1080344 RepID=W9P834_FUSOX|nr:hypothetical protein FOVG_09759 [Fusarium oxysporum f. sp. pisi HDV247]
MEALRNSTGFQRSSSRPRLSTLSNVFSRGKKKRPVISGPIGPVKNSRGPDFTRSKTLIIVPTIKDCSGSDESLSDKENVEARKATRRISASFSAHGSLASPPTVARSGLTATSSCNLNAASCSTSTKTRIPTTKLHLPTTKRTLSSPKPGLTTSSSHQYLSSAAPIKPLPTTSSFQSIYEDLSFESTVQDENFPPSDHKKPALPEHAPQDGSQKNKSHLPKSRTLTVLSDLKTSISRSSLNSKPSASHDSDDPSSRKTSASSTSSLFASTTSRLRLSRASLVSRSSSSSGTTATEVQPDPRHITTSQPSAYWSGRFVSLHDRFLAEEYSNGEATPSGSSPGNPFQYHAMTTDRVAVNSRPTHLSHSTTTSALTSLTGTKPRTPPCNKDARCLRIFQHLESLCITSEARRSLVAWQQSYARRVGKPQLLPQGGRMEDKSLMGKLFGTNQNKGGRRILPAMSESRVPIARQAKPVPAVRGRGKRVSIN